jgi:hypothetical protein
MSVSQTRKANRDLATARTGNAAVLAGQEVLDRVGLAVGGVDGTDQHVVADVVQVTAELEPRASHGNVVCGALALDLRHQGKLSFETKTCAFSMHTRAEALFRFTSKGRSDLDEDGHVDEVLAVPLGKGLQQLQTRALGVNDNRGLAVVRRGLREA